MNTRHLLHRRFPPLTFLAGMLVVLFLPQPAQAQLTLAGSVFSLGGGPSANGTYRLFATIGEPVVGSAMNTSFMLSSGFLPSTAGIVRVDVEEARAEDELPRQFRLHPNYPNPFNPVTTLAFDVKAPTHITLKVFGGFVTMLIGAGGAWAALSIAPLFMAFALTALEFLVAFLQAYVFAMLTCMYLHDALHPGH